MPTKRQPGALADNWRISIYDMHGREIDARNVTCEHWVDAMQRAAQFYMGSNAMTNAYSPAIEVRVRRLYEVV